MRDDGMAGPCVGAAEQSLSSFTGVSLILFLTKQKATAQTGPDGDPI